MLAGGLLMAGVAVAAPHAWAQPWNGSATIYGWVPAIQGSQEGRDG
jgi:hypothetical protein